MKEHLKECYVILAYIAIWKENKEPESSITMKLESAGIAVVKGNFKGCLPAKTGSPSPAIKERKNSPAPTDSWRSPVAESDDDRLPFFTKSHAKFGKQFSATGNKPITNWQAATCMNWRSEGDWRSLLDHKQSADTDNCRIPAKSSPASEWIHPGL